MKRNHSLLARARWVRLVLPVSALAVLVFAAPVGVGPEKSQTLSTSLVLRDSASSIRIQFLGGGVQECKQIRVFHGFGDPRLKLGPSLQTVVREATFNL